MPAFLSNTYLNLFSVRTSSRSQWCGMALQCLCKEVGLDRKGGSSMS